MSLLAVASILITLSAVFAYVNARFLKLPQTIGLMAAALILSIAVLLGDQLGLSTLTWAKLLLDRVDFRETVLEGLLSFLLFAGALHVDLNDLKKHRVPILLLATLGVLISTLVIGVGFHWLTTLFGFEVPLGVCLVFGALISPTDPVAVLAILKEAKVPKALEVKITGESLFNDGIGVVLFIVLSEFVWGKAPLGTAGVIEIFFLEVLGGIGFGLALGYLAYLLLRSIDDYKVEILITLALVMGGYGLASTFHLSGPLAIVVAGLFVGNQGRLLGMSKKTRANLDLFWELIDEIFNAVLFVLIGLELLILRLEGPLLLMGLLVIPLVLLGRFVAVGTPIHLMRKFQRDFSPKVVRILTWGGLRGGISVALALSLPDSEFRELILTVTYVSVVFSILGQGLTLKEFVRRMK